MSARSGYTLLVLAGLLMAPGPAGALASVPDSTAGEATAEYFAPAAGQLARLHLAPYGDLRARGDVVRHRPGATTDLRRTQATLRGGLAWARAGIPLRWEAGARACLGTDRHRDAWAPFQNEATDTLEADRLGLEVWSPRSDALLLGKMVMPLRLTEMLWDGDLRPVGAGVRSPLAWSGLPDLRLAAGFFRRGRLSGPDGQVAAAQLRAGVAQEHRLSAEVLFAWLDFGGLKTLARDGIGRQNRTVTVAGTPAYAAAFRVADLQVGVRTSVGRVPLSLLVDLARNTTTGKDRDGLRARLAAGGPSAPAGAEVAWVYQRVEREVVPGAFNSDDWWFHTRMRGNLLSLEVGTGSAVRLRAQGFLERRDDVALATRRLTVELRARIPER